MKTGQQTPLYREVLDGVGVDGVSFFLVFLCLFCSSVSSLFFFSVFIFIILLYSLRKRANNCSLGKWGILVRPRLHRPHSELLDLEERVAGW